MKCMYCVSGEVISFSENLVEFPFFVFSQSLYLKKREGKIKLSKLDSFIQNFKQQNLLD